jgi:hypothetical protein
MLQVCRKFGLASAIGLEPRKNTLTQGSYRAEACDIWRRHLCNRNPGAGAAFPHDHRVLAADGPFYGGNARELIEMHEGQQRRLSAALAPRRRMFPVAPLSMARQRANGRRLAFCPWFIQRETVSRRLWAYSSVNRRLELTCCCRTAGLLSPREDGGRCSDPPP